MAAPIVVTGGSGRIGRFVVADLLAAGHAVKVVDVAEPTTDVPFAKADVLDLPALGRAFAGAERAIHLAAHDWIAKVPGPEFIRVNAVGTWNVLQAAEEAGVKKIAVASSISATGIEELRADWKPLYLPIDEAHPIQPVEPYSVSKQMVEAAALSFARRGRMAVACLRPVGVAVPGSLERFVKLAADTAKPWFNAYVSAEDTARAFRLAVTRDTGPWCLALVTATDSTAEEPTLEMAKRVFGMLPEVRKPELYKRFPRASLVDVEGARRAFGFEGSTEWAKLRATVKV